MSKLRVVRAIAVSALTMVVAGCPALSPNAVKREAGSQAAQVAAQAADTVKSQPIAPALTLDSGPAPVSAAAPEPGGQIQTPGLVPGDQIAPLEGTLDWGVAGDRLVQFTDADLRAQNTVCLMDASTGAVMACALSDANGRFSLTFGGVSLDTTGATAYILQAARGLGTSSKDLNRAGHANVRLWNIGQPNFGGAGWSFLSKVIALSRGTTALSVVASLRKGSSKQVDLKKHLKSLDTQNKTETCGKILEKYTPPAGSNVSGCGSDANDVSSNYARVYKMIDDAYSLNQDPVGSVAMDANDPDKFLFKPIPPVIASINPTSGTVGTKFQIIGSGFRDGTDASGKQTTLIYINGVPLKTTYKSFTEIEGQIASACGSNCTPSSLNDLVPSSGLLSVGVSGAITLSDKNLAVTPTFSSLSTGTGQAGSNVNINGTGFDPGRSTVFFTGAGGSPNVPASSTVAKNGTTITAAVPRPAVTGPIVVSGPGGNVTTGTYTLDPVIESTDREAGESGTRVNISGSGFGPSGGRVEFGGSNLNGNIAGWNPNSIAVNVPSNANTGNIRVVTSAGKVSPNGPQFRMQYNISGWSFNRNMSPAIMTITGSGFGAGPNSTYQLVGTMSSNRHSEGGSMVRIRSWTGTRIEAAAYGKPGDHSTFQLMTPGGPASGDPNYGVRTIRFVWNGALSRRVVDGTNHLWWHNRGGAIWKVKVNDQGQAEHEISNRHMISNDCRVTNMVLDSFDNLYFSDHCGHVHKYVFDQNMESPHNIWTRGGFPALQRIALDADNNIYVKQHGCRGCRNWARNYYLETHNRDFYDIGVTHGRSTSGGGTMVSSDNRYYVFNARQGRHQRIQQYWKGQPDNPGGRDRWNRGRQWETYCHGGGPARNPHRVPAGLAEDVSGQKWFLHVWGGISRSNSGWGMNARTASYRCSWHATIGTDLNNNVYFGNFGCHGTAGVRIFRGWDANWLGNSSGRSNGIRF